MIVTASSDRLYLPPLFTGRKLDHGHPFDAAVAAAPGLGAGSLLYAERPGLLALALVLEPETPLALARRAFPLLMGAIADALAAGGLPERGVEIGWPGTLFYNAGRIGGGRLAWPAACGEAEIPGWLVFGADLIRDRDRLAEPGFFPETTSLAEEGFEDPLAIIESFARYAMHAFDRWETQGYAAATEPFLRRLAASGGNGATRIGPTDGEARIAPTGGEAARIGLTAGEAARIGPEGDLILRAPGGAECQVPLLPALAAPTWLDPARGEPRL